MQLTNNNFTLYAAKHYDNVNCVDMMEFYEDLNRIKYIKRLFKRYRESGELKERLILNHLIILYNVFENEAITNILLFKLYDYWDLLKPFLVFLSLWPEKFICPIDQIIKVSSSVPLDNNICNLLRKI